LPRPLIVLLEKSLRVQNPITSFNRECPDSKHGSEIVCRLLCLNSCNKQHHIEVENKSKQGPAPLLQHKRRYIDVYKQPFLFLPTQSWILLLSQRKCQQWQIINVCLMLIARSKAGIRRVQRDRNPITVHVISTNIIWRIKRDVDYIFVTSTQINS
jgi:hypothetical protein